MFLPSKSPALSYPKSLMQLLLQNVQFPSRSIPYIASAVLSRIDRIWFTAHPGSSAPCCGMYSPPEQYVPHTSEISNSLPSSSIALSSLCGLLIRYPCIFSQPYLYRYFICPRHSTPSAMTQWPILCAIEIISAVIVFWGFSVFSLSIKLLSIFRQSTYSSRSLASVEYPVPKSSIAIWIFCALSSDIILLISSKSDANIDSVSSIPIFAGSTCISSIILKRLAGKSDLSS